MSVKEMEKTIQYLSFELNGEIFALEISRVREVLDFITPTKVPKTPDYMRGVINLRGRGVPVVDIRLKFGISEIERTVNTCIIIVETNLDGETVLIGALADSVREVFELAQDEIEPPPRVGTRLDIDFIDGMGKRDDQFMIILNIDKVFSEDEVALIDQTGNIAQEMS
jgi:purine-binding chemotaxis protein CheW